MPKRTYAQMEKALLLKVKERPATYAQIQKSTRTNYDTVKDHFERFEKMGFVTVQEGIHPSNGRNSHKVAITKPGKEYVEKL